MAGISKSAYPCAAPGGGGEIRRIGAEDMRILLRPGKKRPVGRFLARMEDGEWMGADTHFGAVPKVMRGTFSEVIEWFIPPNGIVRNASREKDWRAGVSPVVPVRIEGAEVKEWKEAEPQVMGLDGTPVSGRDAEMLTASRKRGGASAAPAMAERDERIIRLYEAGETYDAIAREVGVSSSTVYERLKYLKRIGRYRPPARRDQAAIEARDAQILKMALSGMKWVEIARELGMTDKAVSHRIQAMRDKGMRIPNKAILEAKEANRRMDERTIELVRAGMKSAEISRETGEQKRLVYRRLARLREEGKI